jgi:hypothetical protein
MDEDKAGLPAPRSSKASLTPSRIIAAMRFLPPLFGSFDRSTLTPISQKAEGHGRPVSSVVLLRRPLRKPQLTAPVWTLAPKPFMIALHSFASNKHNDAVWIASR